MLSLISLSPSEVLLSKVSSRIWFWKQTCFHPYLQKAIYQSDMSALKTEMKSKYETESKCTPVNKMGITIVFCGYSRYTTICYLNQQRHRKNFNNLQKQETYKTEISECPWTHSLLLLWMFIWIPQNKVNLFTLFSIPIIFKILSWSNLNIKALWYIVLEYCRHAKLVKLKLLLLWTHLHR